MTGPVSGETAPPEDSLLAARLMREEFGQPAFVSDEAAPVPVVATSAPRGDTAAEASGARHEEFSEPVRVPRARSHRTGMLAGLGVVGALLAVLVMLSPGSGQPRLPVQSVHAVRPLAASGPKTAAATVAPAALPAATPSTTSSTTAPSTPTTQPHRSVTVPSTVTYGYPPGPATPAQTPTTSAPAPAPAPTPTTGPPPPPTTTTTAPPTTTTTAKHCILGLLC